MMRRSQLSPAELVTVLAHMTTLSASQIEKRAGLPRGSIRRWARGTHCPTVHSLIAVAGVCGYRVVVEQQPGR